MELTTISTWSSQTEQFNLPKLWSVLCVSSSITIHSIAFMWSVNIIDMKKKLIANTTDWRHIHIVKWQRSHCTKKSILNAHKKRYRWRHLVKNELIWNIQNLIVLYASVATSLWHLAFNVAYWWIVVWWLYHALVTPCAVDELKNVVDQIKEKTNLYKT